MADSLEPILHTSDENLTTPDRAIVAVSRAIEAHACHSPAPFAALGEHGGNMGAMVLHSTGLWNAQSRCVRRGAILRMKIVYQNQIIPTDLIHRNQIFDRL